MGVEADEGTGRRDSRKGPIDRRITHAHPRRRSEDRRWPTRWLDVIVWAGFALVLLLSIYKFEDISRAADSAFSKLAATPWGRNPHALPFVASLFPLLGLLIGSLLLFNPVLGLSFGNKRRKSPLLASENVISLERFRTITGARGIRPGIAIQAYTLLQPHFNHIRHVRLDDLLQDHLLLTETQVFDLVCSLFRSTNHRPRKGFLYEVTSVMDLLQCVQNSPSNYLAKIELS